jgi:hypothetical protein
LASLWSFTQPHLASRPQSASSSHELLVPSAHQGSKVHLPRAWLTRYVPPSGFDYPLDGLRPSVPCRFSFTPAALMGFTLRSVPLSKGIRRVTARMIPPAVSPVGAPAAVAKGRPSRPRFLGFHPSESPWRPGEGLARRPLDAPLGFALPGSSAARLVRDFARTPLTRFFELTITRQPVGAPESHQLATDPIHRRTRRRRARIRQPS